MKNYRHSFVPKEVQQQHSVKSSGDRTITSFKELPLLTDLIYVQVLACQNKHPYFETSGAVDRCQNIANTFCALFTGRNRSNTSTNQKTVCSCLYVTIKGRGTVHQISAFFFCNFHQLPALYLPAPQIWDGEQARRCFGDNLWNDILIRPVEEKAQLRVAKDILRYLKF